MDGPGSLPLPTAAQLQQILKDKGNAAFKSRRFQGVLVPVWWWGGGARVWGICL
jgi:hypothetical protein